MRAAPIRTPSRVPVTPCRDDDDQRGNMLVTIARKTVKGIFADAPMRLRHHFPVIAFKQPAFWQQTINKLHTLFGENSSESSTATATACGGSRDLNRHLIVLLVRLCFLRALRGLIFPAACPCSSRPTKHSRRAKRCTRLNRRALSSYVCLPVGFPHRNLSTSRFQTQADARQ